MPRREPRPLGGFTLVELLIALSVASILLGAIYGSFAATTRSVERLRSWSGADRGARLLFAMFRSDVASAFERNRPASNGEEGGGSGFDVLEDSEDADFRGVAETRDGELFLFLGVEPQGRDGSPGGLARVSYVYSRSEGAILRVAAPDYPPANDGASGREGRSRALARGVVSARAAFHDGERWKDEWDSEREEGLPRAVSLTVTIEREDGGRQTYRSVARVDAARREEDGPVRRVEEEVVR